MAWHKTMMAGVAMVMAALCLTIGAEAANLTSTVTDLDKIIRIKPDYPIPAEPHQLFYIERSSNSNTVVYCAKLDKKGQFDRDDPVIAYWRWYNVDGHKKGLNFAERMMAYGIKSVTRHKKDGSYSFHLAALPERTIYVRKDHSGKPIAFMKAGKRWMRLEYVYLEVDDSGLLPSIPELDLFGYDLTSGKPMREHLVNH